VSTATPAVVLRLAPDRLHYGAVGVARSLGRLGVRVFLVDDERRTVAGSSRYAAGTVTLNGAGDSDQAVEALLRLAVRIGGRPVLIPFDDPAALVVDRHAEVLGDAFTFHRQPTELVETLLDKWTMTQLARRHDVPVPETVRASAESEAEELLERLPYPLVLKGAESYVPGTSERAELRVVETRAEALAAYGAMSEAERANVMFQEYIPGGPESIWMFNGYFDEDSECRVAFTGRKLRQWPPDIGATSLGVAVPNEKVAALTKRFMKAIGYRGVLDIGYRYDERDGKYKLLDVNPRLGSTFRLFVDERTEVDVVRALYLDLTGQDVPSAEQPLERKWIVEDRDLRASLAYRRAGRLPLGTWLRSLRGTDEAAWFAWSDPVPFARMLLRLVAGSFRRTRRRLGERRR
jgi:D-aspartate ligase